MRSLLTAFLLTLSCLSFSQPRQQIIDSLFYGTGSPRRAFPGVGLVIGIHWQGQTSYHAIGTRNKNGQTLLDSNTLFEIGSATKTFTALLLAKAITEKKVAENAFIDNYLPKEIRLAPALRNKIRLTELASHQSGLPNLSNDRYFTDLLQKDPGNPFRFVDNAYLYSVLNETDSLHGYGNYQYNNYAFALLGLALTQLRQLGYEALLNRDILKPLGMSNTSLMVPATGNRAGLYNQQGEPQAYLILDAVNPAGGLKSNAVDLMKYLRAHLSPNPLSKAIRLTQRPHYRDEKRIVGLGWDIKEDYYQKDGDTFGNSMLMRYSPARQIAIVVLSDHQNGQLVSDVMDFVYSRLGK